MIKIQGMSLLLYVGLVSFGVNAFAADPNGYNSTYERAIGTVPNSCDQIITTADGDWSKITNNPSDSVFCLESGDHSSKDQLTISFSGTSSKPKWLRYYSSQDSGKDPVAQGTQERAILKNIKFDDASNWIIHRITINVGGTSKQGLEFPKNGNSDNNIISHVLIENSAMGLVLLGVGNDNNTIQNSVLRNTIAKVDAEPNCIHLANGPDNTRIVNNEIYNCNKSLYINEWGTAAGTVVENNDLYITNQRYTDCNGKYTSAGPCASSKAVVSMKSAGIADAPVILIHNRIWGARTNDTNICCTAQDSGEAITISNAPQSDGSTIGDANYVVIKNNVIMDSQSGIIWTRAGTHHHAIIGNLFYNIHRFNDDPVRNRPSYALAQRQGTDVDIILNTIVDTDSWLAAQSGTQRNDIKCNVVIDSGAKEGGTVPSNTIIDNNAFYATPTYTANGLNSNIVGSADDSKSENYCFYRKLQTGPEKICVSNALPTVSSPHYLACNGNFESKSGLISIN
jgi:hypothetical protein